MMYGHKSYEGLWEVYLETLKCRLEDNINRNGRQEEKCIRLIEDAASFGDGHKFGRRVKSSEQRVKMNMEQQRGNPV